MALRLVSEYKRQIYLITFAYFFIAFSFLIYYGVNSTGEAFKYLLDAKSIAEGRELNYGEFSYFFITYSFFLSLFIKLNISLWVVAIFQICLSYFAGYTLYKLMNYTSSNHYLGILIFFFYLFCYSIQKWTLFIYSEGVYSSAVVIGFCWFVDLFRKYSLIKLIGFCAISLAIVTIRPVGVLFLLTAFIVLIIFCAQKKKFKILSVAIFLGVVFCVGVLNSPVRYFINPDSLKRMELICMVPEAGSNADYKQFNKTGLEGAYYVIKDEIGFSNFLKAGIKKMQFFFGFVRPYYSLKNNLFLVINWLFYPFAFIGILFSKHSKLGGIRLFSTLFILINSASIFITCDDWSNRFIAPVFPFVILLAGIGLDFLRTKFFIN